MTVRSSRLPICVGRNADRVGERRRHRRVGGRRRWREEWRRRSPRCHRRTRTNRRAGRGSTSRMSKGGDALAPDPKSSQATVTWPPSFWLITSCGCELSCRAEIATHADGLHAAERQRFLIARRIGNGSPDDQLGPVRVVAGTGIWIGIGGFGVDAGPGDVDVVRVGIEDRRAGGRGRVRRPGSGRWPRPSRSPTDRRCRYWAGSAGLGVPPEKLNFGQLQRAVVGAGGLETQDVEHCPGRRIRRSDRSPGYRPSAGWR